MSAELDQVRADARELADAREELAAQLSSVESDLSRTRAEAQALPAIKADIETMRREIQRGRYNKIFLLCVSLKFFSFDWCVLLLFVLMALFICIHAVFRFMDV